MKKRNIKDINVKGKRVLLRVDFNVPIDENGKIIDDNRILEALSTITYLVENKAKIVICSHLGRPDGKVDKKYTLKPVADRLAQLVKAKVYFAEDTIGKDAKAKAAKLEDGEILLLENLRFQKEEEENDPKFCKALASFGDIYVNDAFGTCHRKHASVYGVAELLPNATGFLVGKELKVINQLLEEPKKPFVAILGGAKVKDKISVIENLLTKVDTLLIGGGMAYTFVKALGGNIGDSLLDKDNIEYAKKLLDKAGEKNVKVFLPVDVVCAKEFKNDTKAKTMGIFAIEDGWQGLDIGPKTVKIFKKQIKHAQTLIWNGPLGVYEFDNFKKGTEQIAKAVSKCKGFTFIGGGDSAAAVIKLGYAKKVNHISTGGGASLTLLEGKTLPGIDVISNKRG